MNLQNNRCLALFSEEESTLINAKHPVHIIVFKVVTCDSDITPKIILPHGLTIKTEAYIKWCPRTRNWLLKDLTSSNRILPPDTQRRELSLEFQKSSETTLTLTSGRLALEITVPLIIAVELETCKTPCNIKERLKAGIKAALTN